ncbi:hypothetical protein GCM10022221_18120 [Actinocorallia aurea]
MIKAVKNQKARTNSGTCGLCRGPVLVGQRVSRYRGMTSWVHSRCAVRLCDGCGARLSLTLIAAQATSHPMCEGKPE